MMLRNGIGFVLVGTLALSACSKEDEPTLKNEGESCSLDKDCADGLACRDAVCVIAAVSDMGTGDGGGDASPNNDNNTPVEDEDYIISYVIRDFSSTDTVWVYDANRGTHTQVTPEGEECQLGCWITDDLSTYVDARANGPNFDVWAGDIGGDWTVSNREIIAANVRRIEVVGNAITFVREEAGDNKAYYQPIGGSERLVGSIGSVTSTEGDWHLEPEQNLAVVYNATLQTMDVKIGDLDQEVTQLTYTIDSSNYQETSGSYFGGSIPTAFSRDGSVMALVTQKAPNDYNLCANESECTGVGQRCGRFGRCSVIEVAVHFFDLDNLGTLNQPCSADDSCGGIHTCDIPAETAVDQAVCIPRRVVLGLPGQQMQNGETGCALTSGNDDLFYTDVRAPISFGPDGDLYLTAARACDELDIEHTAILRVTPNNGNYAVVYGNDGKDFSPDDCYDPVEEDVDVTNCTVWIQRALVSPQGNELVFVGTNPNVIEPGLAQSNVDVWTVKRDGSDHNWVGEHEELDVVRSIRVHPPRP